MKINEKINTVLACNNFKRCMLDYNKSYYVTGTTFKKIIEQINKYQKHFIIFEYTLSFLKIEEIKEIILLLKEKNINFLNITLNEEEFLLSNYMIVKDNNKIILEGKTKDVLKEEKILKRLGYYLPFIVDLSIQLKCYGLTDEIYYRQNKLIEALWN